MRRRPGRLTPLEISIVEAVLSLRSRSHEAFYGFLVAKEMKALAGARYRTAHGTLYKTLERMELAGMLSSAWEDAGVALAEGRPRRRLYELTAKAEAAYHEQTRTAGVRPLTSEPRGGAA